MWFPESTIEDLHSFLNEAEADGFYRRPRAGDWTGRVDSEDREEYFRIHQQIRMMDSQWSSDSWEVAGAGTAGEELPGIRGVAIIGFCCDEGVGRNGGRRGAAGGPAAIRRALCSLAVLTNLPVLVDAGDILCPDGRLEESQARLAGLVSRLRKGRLLSVVLGGGHETAWGHYRGLLDSGSVPAILNFDAHLDMRIQDRPSSGTPFMDIARHCAAHNLPFRYLCAGLRPEANTAGLRQDAAASGAAWVDMLQLGRSEGRDLVQRYIRDSGQDGLYLSIDLDVFSSSLVPGVSAPGPWGADPADVLMPCIQAAALGRLCALDIVELNPVFDESARSASIAASLIWNILNALASSD